jgi:hypothetical protein
LLFAASWILGSPPVLLLLLLLLADTFFFRWRVALVARMRRWRFERRLRTTLTGNPHDRKARHDLAGLLIQRRSFKEALELLRANIEAGDEDAETLRMMGSACFGAGFAEQGEVFLAESRDREDGHAMGAANLELGRGRLMVGNPTGAIDALRKLCAARPGTIEGRVLLAEAFKKSGDGRAARNELREAWSSWLHAPRFVRRRDRGWAFRVHPVPFIVVGMSLIAGCLVLCVVVPGTLLRGVSAAMLSTLPGEAFAGTEVPLPDASRAPALLADGLDIEVESNELDRLNYELAALLDRSPALPLFTRAGQRLRVHFDGGAEGKDLVGPLRAIRRLSAIEPALPFSLSLGGHTTSARAGEFADGDPLRLQVFLLKRMGSLQAGFDPVFELDLRITAASSDAIRVERELRLALASAASRGEFDHARPTVRLGQTSTGLRLVTAIPNDTRTAVAVLEAIQPVLCPATGNCLTTVGAERGRIPLAEASMIGKTESGSSFAGRSLLEWFRSIDSELVGFSDTKATEPRVPTVVLRREALGPALRGRQLCWESDPGWGTFCLEADGKLTAGNTRAPPGPNEPVRVLGTGASACIPSASGCRALGVGRSAGSFEGQAVWIRTDIDAMYANGLALSRTGKLHQWVTLQSAIGESWRSEDIHPGGPYWAHARQGDLVFLDEDSGGAERLAAVSLHNRSVSRFKPLPPRWSVERLLDAGDGRLVVVLGPALVRAGELGIRSNDRGIAIVTGDEVRMVTETMPSDWTQPIAIVGESLWIWARDGKGVAAVSLRDGSITAPVRHPALPADAEIVAAIRPGHATGPLAVTTAHHGIWMIEGEKAARLAPADDGNAAVGLSPEGVIVLVRPFRSGTRIALIASDGHGQATLDLPLPTNSIRWAGGFD